MRKGLILIGEHCAVAAIEDCHAWPVALAGDEVGATLAGLALGAGELAGAFFEGVEALACRVVFAMQCHVFADQVRLQSNLGCGVNSPDVI